MPRSPTPARANAVRSQSHGNAASRASAGNTVRASNSAYTNATASHPGKPNTSAAIAQIQANRSQARVNNSQAALNASQARLNRTSVVANQTGTLASNSSTTGTLNSSGSTIPRTASATTAAPGVYTYGTGNNASNYRAYGYGSGYRNRSYRRGYGYGYGRSQNSNRGIVQRLRSVQMSLAQVDHDYQGHRVRAMHSISMAIRQLSHRSMVYSNVGFASNMNGGMGMGLGRGNNQNRNGGNRNGMRMSQAQSDSRMSQALRNLQGIGMQLSNQGYGSSGHARALGHIQHATQELNIALSIR
jgi:hypothetical protein